jgi:hypothetical protein
MQLRTDRTYDLPFDVASFWRRIEHVEQYRDWWPWLRRFEATPLASGERWVCRVRPPVPYGVTFAVHLDEVDRPDRIEARVSGDIGGTASLSIAPTGSGCTIRLVSDLAPRSRALRALSWVARPVVRYGHDSILASGVRQFTERSRG